MTPDQISEVLWALRIIVPCVTFTAVSMLLQALSGRK